MKFIVSSTALSSHLQAISRVINSKNALPILDCFLFELQDGTLSATVSDSETTMVTTVEVNESDMDGRFAVTAKTLLDALKEIPEQPLTFEINTDSLEITVQYQNGKYSLMGQNADEFPQSAMLGDNAVRVEMDAQVLLGGINRAVFATADDELRPVIPQNNPYKVTVDRLQLLGALRRVSIFSSQASSLIKLRMQENLIVISAQDIDFSTSAEETLVCQYAGNPMSIGFKSTFLIDILNNISADEIVIELADPSRAGVIIPVEQEENEDLLMLLMPMMLND